MNVSHECGAGRPGRGQPAAGPGRRPHEPQGHRPGPGLPAGTHPVPGPHQPSGRLLRPPSELTFYLFVSSEQSSVSVSQVLVQLVDSLFHHAAVRLTLDWLLFPGDPLPGRMSSQQGEAEGGVGDDAEPPERCAEVSLMLTH